MTGLVRGSARGSGWLLLVVVVLAHIGLAAVAVAEYARLGWLFETRFDLAAVTAVLVTALAGLAEAVHVAARAAKGGGSLRRLLRSGREPCPAAAAEAIAALGLSGRVDAVGDDDAFAVTYGLLRPRILISTGLAAALSRDELAAVLAHERHHLRRRDPLRLLAARVAAGYGCWLPVSSWLAGRFALRQELACDRAAVTSTGRQVLAAALLKLADAPQCPALAAANPPGDAPGSLEARVAQLEDGRPPRQRPATGRVLASAGIVPLLMAAGVCCVGLSQALPGGVL
jgi:Zn-dependent protease with chaperone function